jgi:hypothetical protein
MHQGSCGFHDYIKAERLDKRDFAWKGVPACSFGEPMRTRDQGVNTLDWYLQEVIDMICSSQKEVAYHGKRSNEQGNR